MTRLTGQETTAIEKKVGYTHIFQEMGHNTPWQQGRGEQAVGRECVLHRKAWKLIKRFGGKQTGTRTFIVASAGRNTNQSKQVEN